MKHLAALLALAAAVGCATPATAQDSPDARRRAGKAQQAGQRAPPRSSTEARNGTCQRDNGRSLGSLNLNHACDRREFWDRMNERGNDRN